MPDVRSILDPLAVPQAVKAQAWNEFQAASDPNDFRRRFDGLKLPQQAKAALWEAKFGESVAAPAPSVTGTAGPDRLFGQQTPGLENARISSLPKPGLLDRLKGMVTGDVWSGDTLLTRLISPKPSEPVLAALDKTQVPLGQTPILRPEALTPERGPQRAIAQFAGGLTSPENLMLLATINKVARIPKVGILLQRAASGGFSYGMLTSALSEDPEWNEARAMGNLPVLGEIATRKLLEIAFGAAAGAHALRGGVPAAAEAKPPVRPAEAPTAERTATGYQQPAGTALLERFGAVAQEQAAAKAVADSAFPSQLGKEAAPPAPVAVTEPIAAPGPGRPAAPAIGRATAEQPMGLKQRASIVARRGELGLSEGQYRLILQRVSGQTSLDKLTSDQAVRVLGEMEGIEAGGPRPLPETQIRMATELARARKTINITALEQEIGIPRAQARDLFRDLWQNGVIDRLGRRVESQAAAQGAAPANAPPAGEGQAPPATEGAPDTVLYDRAAALAIKYGRINRTGLQNALVVGPRQAQQLLAQLIEKDVVDPFGKIRKKAPAALPGALVQRGPAPIAAPPTAPVAEGLPPGPQPGRPALGPELPPQPSRVAPETTYEKPTPEDLLAERRGQTQELATPRGTKANAEWVLLDLAKDPVITSHNLAGNENPQYPPGLQNRDRSRIASEAQIREIARQPDAKRLAASYLSSEGAPVYAKIGDRRVILSGNGRTEALRLAYQQGTAENYRAGLPDELKAVGLDPKSLEGMQEPILARAISGEVPLEKFARESNEPSAAARAASEVARSDASRLTGPVMESFQSSENGEILTAANRDFVRAFFDQLIPPTERGQFMQSDGTISQAGLNRIRNAVFAKAYGDTGALEKLAESPDSNIRNITAGMVRAAPDFARLTEGIAAGDRHDLSIASDIAAAARKLSALREEGNQVADYLAQGELFAPELTPEARELLRVFAQHSRSAARIGEFLQDYVRTVDALGSPKQEALFGARIPTKLEILTAAAETAEEAGNVSSKVRPGPGGRGPEVEGAAAPSEAAIISASARAETAAEGQQGPVIPQLPSILAGAKPRYSFGAKQFDLEFASDVDKAAYIAAQTKPSKADAQYVAFAAQNLGMTPGGVRMAGVRVRSAIKDLARDSEPGTLRVPEVLARPERRQPGLFATEPTREDFFAGEEGSFNPTAIKSRLVQAGLVPEAGAPKVNYSGLGRIKDIFVRNLSQLEKASPAGHEAAVHAAGSRGEAAVLLRAAVPRIQADLGTGGPNWNEFRTALIESRLRGIRERWQNMADQVLEATPKQLQERMDNGLMQLLENIEGQRGIPQDVSQSAAAMAQSAMQGEMVQKKPGGPALPILNEGPAFDDLKVFLSNTFEDAAASVARVMTPADFDRITQSPGFAKGLETYKNLLEKPMAENHALNEGVFSDALGPVNTYYPLVPVSRADVPTKLARSTPYARPRNIANDFATGLATGYDASMEALTQRLTRAFRSNNKAAMLQTLEDQGLLRVLKPGEVAGDTIEIGGEPFKAMTVEARGPRQILKNGKIAFAPSQAAVVPKWLAKELKPILEANRYDQEGVSRLMQAINGYSLVGPLDLVFHSTNLIGSMTANTPFLPSKGLFRTVVGNLPFAKQFESIVRIATTDPTTVEATSDLTEMAKLGLIPNRYGSVTYSRRFAEQTGAQKTWFPRSSTPLLYGPKGLDVRARLAMYRIAKQLDPEGSVQDRTKFVNQLGAYVPGLQGSIERAMKASGLSPFYTAGSTMVRNGINAFLGRGPITSNKWSYRLAQQLTGGAVGMIAVWALTNKAYRDKWPWEEDEAKFMQIPLKESDRDSALGRQLYGTKTGTAYVNLAFFNPLLARGTRTLGLSDAFETRQLGGSADQMLEAGVRGSVNSLAHPMTSGPLFRAGTVAMTGSEPYVTDVNPPKLMQASRRHRSFIRQVAENVAEGVMSVNNFFQSVASRVGLGYKADKEEEKGNRYLRMMTDLVVPRLVGAVSDQSGKAARLSSERNKPDEGASGTLPVEERQTMGAGAGAAESKLLE
jgi:hypothetical protein